MLADFALPLLHREEKLRHLFKPFAPLSLERENDRRPLELGLLSRLGGWR